MRSWSNITPEVSGRMVSVAVSDNPYVHKRGVAGHRKSRRHIRALRLAFLDQLRRRMGQKSDGCPGASSSGAAEDFCPRRRRCWHNRMILRF